MTIQSDTFPEDAPTTFGRRSMGNEDPTIVDLAEYEPTTMASDVFDHQPSHDEIAAEAYAIFEARGSHHGGDTDDWLEAERRLRERARG